MSTTNNAVCEAKVGGADYVYSFGGLDSTKIYTGTHQKSFKYDVANDSWVAIPDLPDTLGKIAASASYVNGKIYIIGGYHVFQNNLEQSSSRVHIYDPQTDQFLADGTPVPIPIDDQVQCVYQDSLIYVITGWFNTGNVALVQIYDPANDIWLQGTSVPNTNDYKAFGANGIIVGNKIYYYGGASTATNFPAQEILRKGNIDPNNPTNIDWLPIETYIGYPTYRMVALGNLDGTISFIGGSNASYNYNGLSYTNNIGVPPSENNVIYSPTAQNISLKYNVDYPMDLRGYGNVNDSTKFLCGGMIHGQKVSNRCIRLNYMADPLSQFDYEVPLVQSLSPNPSSSIFILELSSPFYFKQYQVINRQGATLLAGTINTTTIKIDLGKYPNGIYFLRLLGEKTIVKDLIKK